MKPKEILLLIIPTFLFVVFWVIFSVVHNANTSTISEKQTETINPIAPSFDTETIAALKARISVEPLYTLSETGSEGTPLASPGASFSTTNPSPSQTAITLTPTASPAGGLIP